MATPLMSLDLPVVGPSGTIGPTYATMLNTAFNLIDSHDHTTGKGPKVTPAGINVNQNFNFSGFGIYGLNYAKLIDNVATVSDFTSVYAEGGDLYWKNAGGVDVQITSGNTINVTAAGGIGGDYTTSTASVVYSDITKTYTFRQSPTVTGDIAAGSLYVYENIVSGKYAKLKVPAALAANYDLTLPAALPGSTLPAFISSSGVITTGQIGAVMALASTDNSTLEVSSNALRIKDGGVTKSKLVALGQQLSASSAVFSTSSNSYVDVTNLTVTITTTGRPVMLIVIPDGSTTNVAAFGVSGASGSKGAQAQFLRAATVIAIFNLFGGASTSSLEVPPGSLCSVDVVAAGTYTYKVQIKAQNVGDSTTLNRCKFIAYEL